MGVSESTLSSFKSLFNGFDEAFGTGQGRWVEREPSRVDFQAHLEGMGPGLGIGPLMRDSNVHFAAIDLDEPDFKAAVEMQEFIPGTSFIERSRSGNAHVWVFFSAPVEAYIARGILKEAVLAAGKAGVEVFPKQDAWHDRIKFGSYINLPYYGDERPILPIGKQAGYGYGGPGGDVLSCSDFITAARAHLNDPMDWRKRARWLLIEPPQERERTSEPGTQKELHICAEHIIAERDENPLVEGHRNAVMFALAKMLSNYEGFDHDEERMMLDLVNESSDDPLPPGEVSRIHSNAEGWTSTDCDNPLVEPYTHPDCPIAHPRR